MQRGLWRERPEPADIALQRELRVLPRRTRPIQLLRLEGRDRNSVPEPDARRVGQHQRERLRCGVRHNTRRRLFLRRATQDQHPAIRARAR